MCESNPFSLDLQNSKRLVCVDSGIESLYMQVCHLYHTHILLFEDECFCI